MNNLQKKAIRIEMREKLRTLTPDFIQLESKFCLERLLSYPPFLSATVICSYISMPKEVQTYDILKSALLLNKRVFIPKITGKNSEDMVMLEIFSFDEVMNFPKNSWNIPEPPTDLATLRPDGTTLGEIDFVIVPGLAFDNTCARVGHGKGYYGEMNGLYTAVDSYELL